MVECVCSCEDCIVFLFVVIGVMSRTSCILILLFIVVCRGRGSFCEHVGCLIGVHLRKCWNFHFIMCFPTSVDPASGAPHVEVCVFTSGFVLHVPTTECVPCVNICWRREESLCLKQFCFDKFSRNTWCSCFSFWCGWSIRIIPQSGACFGAKLKSMRAYIVAVWRIAGISVGGGGRFIFRCPS